MTEEEQKQLENHFESALNDLVSGIKDTTATEVVMREQQMILFYKRVMLEIEKRDNLISKLQKELDKKDKVIEKLLYKKAQSVLYDCKEEEILKYKEELKQGYYKKVEEENE